MSNILGQSLIRGTNRLVRTRLAPQCRIDSEYLAVAKLNRPLSEPLNPDLRALQIHQQADRPVLLLGTFSEQGRPPPMIFRRAVGHVDTSYIDTLLNQGSHDLGIVGRRTQGDDDLGASFYFHEAVTDMKQALTLRACHNAQHHQRAAQASRIDTAGRSFPSKNSRKAPPPVDI